MNRFLEITDANFETQVLAAKVPVLLDFTATWCPPCRALDPILASLLEEADGRFLIGKIDVDANPEITGRYGVRSAPTLITFVDGKPVRSHIGLTSREKVRSMVLSPA
jgi:thioredoxin 1